MRRTLSAVLCVGLSATSLPLAAQPAPADMSVGGGGNTKSSSAAPRVGNHAQDAEPEAPPAAALDHYLRGRRHYLAGRYRDALAELKAAHELDSSAPDLLYNIARVYENLGELDQAIAYYQRYLAMIPLSELEERDQTEKTIRRLQGAKREIEPQKTDALKARESAATVGAGRADLAFWITSGAALALLAGGATCGILAVHNYDRVKDFVVGVDGSLEQRQNLSDSAKRFALLTDGLLIGGGVALTSAALLFLLRDPERPEPKASELRFDLKLSQGRGLLSVRGHF